MPRVKIGILAVICVGIGTAIYLLAFRPPASVPVSTSPTATTKLPPTAIKIAKLGLNIPVQAAVVRGNQWDMYDHSVAWLSTSAVPGEGNVILYAHNRKGLFRDLYLLKPGDSVLIQQRDKWVTYVVDESRAVKDSDVNSVLSLDNRLTLFTCEGSFDQKRRVVYASLLQ